MTATRATAILIDEELDQEGAKNADVRHEAIKRCRTKPLPVLPQLHFLINRTENVDATPIQHFEPNSFTRLQKIRPSLFELDHFPCTNLGDAGRPGDRISI
jgi:hypothetical protein